MKKKKKVKYIDPLGNEMKPDPELMKKIDAIPTDELTLSESLEIFIKILNDWVREQNIKHNKNEHSARHLKLTPLTTAISC